ncbi:phosphorylase [Halobiforma lacisalsi AJ5]|uniref:Phosphorylase n=1 Tax=Natronobacterium lacisalsi AJ5 TaxID=358396 RepID=M0LE54_NATLA|nr:purine nucleoside permease [Halobiforma lacisalsi]APW96394.1 phosphorylase [Halobiforma lacisalsi AJ5]EMA31837.1 purine nucleoside permease [Halobiforma lacisalsi AJ5]
MTDELELPEPEPLESATDRPLSPSVLVLPAVAEPPIDERRPWLERRADRLERAISVPGSATPVYLTTDGVAITTTGIGKSDAATTVAALFATPLLDLSSAYVVSAGIAGGAPDRIALGSVVLADAVVDWDRKHRWDRGEETEGETPPIERLAYRPRDYVHRLEPTLVETALDAAREVDLGDDPDVLAYQRRYPDAPDGGPTVDRGTTLCGDEFWHGPRYAREAAWLCERYGVDPYVTTQMEDAATATALERFDAGKRYLSVRAVSNYDRPAPGESVAESFDGTEATLALAIENAERVGSAVVSELLEVDPLGIR